MRIKKLFFHWGIPILLFALFVLFAIWLNSYEKIPLISRSGQTFEKGIVSEVLKDNLQQDGTRIGEQRVLVHMTTGIRKGEDIEMTSSSGYLFGAGCTVGMKVVVIQNVSGESTVSAVYSRDRGGILFCFAGLYLLVLCLVGGKQGVKGALGLLFTFLSIIFVYLPMVGRGMSPFYTAVFVCAVTTLATMWLIGGPTKKTAVATCGAIIGVVIAGLTAALFSKASGITGWNVSDIESLMTLANTSDIQVGGLLFSGLLISTLGAVMDVAMSLSSAILEVHIQNPSLTRWELFRSGMRIGRDLMGTDSNTLILAFAGTSVSMLVLDYAYDLPLLQIINSNNIGIAVMQGLSGSFGVVLAVPATVAMAVWMYSKGKENA